MNGRAETYTGESVINASTIPRIVSDIWQTHRANVTDCDYLINYLKGKQPILNRVKEVREDITYNTVVNFANSIIRDGVGYFLSSPMQYTLRDTAKQGEFDKFKTVIATEEKNSIDFEVAMYAAICGVGYMMTLPGADGLQYLSLDPRCSCVVRSSQMTHEPLFGFTYYYGDEKKDLYIDVRSAGMRYLYRASGTGSGMGSGTVSGLTGKLTTDWELLDSALLNLPACPIVEYRNNVFLMGDFETALPILDGINTLSSNALEDIEQFVQSYLVLINATLDDDNVAKMKLDKIIQLVSADGSKNVDAKFIAAQLNPQSVQNMRESLNKTLMFITATPERMESPGGSPTGAGVSLGYGYPAQEHNARGKDMSWYKAERDTIAITLELLKKRGDIGTLESRDVSPRLNRTLFETAQSNAQTSAMMVNAKLWSPEDGIRFASPTSDTEQAIQNAKLAWGDEFGNANIDKATDAGGTEGNG